MPDKTEGPPKTQVRSWAAAGGGKGEQNAPEHTMTIPAEAEESGVLDGTGLIFGLTRLAD
jgi:hypothetical protein